MLSLKNNLLVSFLLAGYYCVVYCQGTENQTTAQPTVPVTPVIQKTTTTTTTTTTELPVLTGEGKPSWELNKEDNKDFFAQWLIDGCWGSSCVKVQAHNESEIEYEGYDGFYNNLAQPDLGAIDTPLLRRVPAVYEDGVYKLLEKDRPNPLSLSENLMKQKENLTKSSTGKTALLVFFGQQVVEEILDAQRPACPPEYINLKIPEDHTFHGQGIKIMPVLRTRYSMETGFSPNNPRQQLNEITPWIDGGLVYGTTKTWSDQLRLDENMKIVKRGLLASHEGKKLFPAKNNIRIPMANPPPPSNHSEWIEKHETANVNRFFKLGNPRGNENPFLLTFGILWFRWHNYIASHLGKNEHWSDEKVYNEARKWVIATYQHIVINTWLPEWLGRSLPKYKDYDPSINPQIDQFFQSAAFRFGHTLVPPGVYVRDYGRRGCQLRYPGHINPSVRTCQNYWKPQESITTKFENNEYLDIDRLLMGMAFQLCEKEDHSIIEDLRENVFGPLEFSRRDLMAINIQRARDHGLPDYNTARRAYNLPPVDFSHFSHVNSEIVEKFKSLYKNSTNNIDVWVGGLLETKEGPGELFAKIIEDQFRRIRDGDRFWYRNKQNRLFTNEEIERIEQLTIYDVIMAVTELSYNDIQENPFRAPFSISKLHENCRDHLEKGNCSRGGRNYTCYQFKHPLQFQEMEKCSKLATYDYFSNSELSYIGTFIGIGVVIITLGGSLYSCAELKKRKRLQEQKGLAAKVRESFRREERQITPYSVTEWVEHRKPTRQVLILLDASLKQIQVRNQLGHILRAIDLTHSSILHVFIVSDGQHLMLRVSNDYDLVIKFDGQYTRNSFLQCLEDFIEQVNIARERINVTLQAVLKQAITRRDRQKRLEMFFRVVFSQAFHISHSEEEILNLDAKAAREVIYTELTINEFAEALSMQAESEFVHKMFTLVDKDHNGFVSFREFVDMLIIFAKGTADDKVKLMFDMYDINGTGKLTKEDFKNMIKSLLETVNADVDQTSLEDLISSMMLQAGIINKEAMTREDFQSLLIDYKDKLGCTQLSFPGFTNTNQNPNHRPSFMETARRIAFSLYSDPREINKRHPPVAKVFSMPEVEEIVIDLKTKEEEFKKHTFLLALRRVIENYSREIFWATLYTLVLLAIFAERAYYYSVEREHSGLRRIAGYGVTVTRGAASAMMFTYSSMLITMCRNTITLLRDTPLHVYIPFDSAVQMHKYIAAWALVFTVLHVIGHAFNFYSISTQTSDDLTCLFRNYHHATHEIPKFHYWCWQTITGVTGVLLTILTAIMFIFSLRFAREHLYNAFWISHSLYPFFFILMILHGTGRLIQEPFMHYFLLGPCILYTIDHLVTVVTKKVEVPVLKAELLPSEVTKLEFKKPINFEFKSGQWIRIACTALSTSEYHPFTISSAPHENNLTVHIRSVGPWTTNIRKLVEDCLLQERKLPKIHIEGPYGEGHQDWYQFEVSVLVGGGIGVTPFASILKDIVCRSNDVQQTICKKVYFLWITKTQKHFEWLVDIIREVENVDEKRAVSVHICITQFYQKFDLRTILLYICERHFQRICNRSLFTGLKAVTHFGRPNFTDFFKSLQAVHPKVRKIGVFSCGSPPLTQTVDKICVNLNKETLNGPTFQHHFKNF